MKYETVVHIVTSGKNKIEAGEKAGSVIRDMGDASEMWVNPTRERRAYPRPRLSYKK
jgi:hypothetical protein